MVASKISSVISKNPVQEDARVVYQHVDVPERFDRSPDDPLSVLRYSDIPLQKQG